MLKRRNSLTLPFSKGTPGFSVVLDGNTFRLKATGVWTIRNVAMLDEELRVLDPPLPPSQDFTGTLDISEIEQLDTAGAWLLNRTASAWEARGLKTDFDGGGQEFKILLDEVRKSEDVGRPAIFRQNPLERLWQDLLDAVAGIGRDFSVLLGFLGLVAETFARVVRQPRRFRFVPFVHHIEHVGFRAVPIVSLICFLIGAVILQQGVIQLQSYGAEPFAVNMLSVLALREVGVLLTAIMVAGRSGSAFTAEIGAMKMREEIDAMRTMGIDPIETLVIPRIAALVVIIPLLTFVGDFMCLLGGAVMAKFYLGMDFWTYLDRLHESASMSHFMAGMVKSPFVALIIGLVGCVEGMRVAGNAESLGKHVTSAVVKAIFLVIVVDALFAIFLVALGV